MPILNAQGTPARTTATICPKCAGEKRIVSAGFGAPHPVCARCGYEWHGEPWLPTEEAS